MKTAVSVMCMRKASALASALYRRGTSATRIPSFYRSSRCAGFILWGLLLIATAASTCADAADGVPRLGRRLSPAETVGAGVTIFADGRGLPAGSGDARLGLQVFAQHCARCHGAGGRGGSAPELVGGTAPLTSARPDRTIGLVWPFAASLFDFNWRAMPMDKPGILSADEAYAVTAFLLSAEGIIGDSAVMNRETLPKVQMPNRAGFDWIDVRPQPGR